jgi:cyclohexanecarboxylate-CoA ligase
MLRPTIADVETADRYRRDGHWGGAPLGGRFAATCARQRYADALIDGERRVSFAEWERLAQRAALGLRALGVGPGDVVAYQLPNWWEAAVMFLAAARVGALVNPVLPLFRARELRFILRQSNAAVLIIPGTFRGFDYPQLIASLRADLPALREVLVARGEAAPPLRSFESFLATPWERAAPQTADGVIGPVDPASLLMLMYTSGTTADPKGVLHTHDTLIAEVQSLARIHAFTPADRTLMPSPLTHISGVVHAILTPALLGTSAVLMERWDAGQGLELIARERVTYMVGAPTFLQDLVAHPARADHDASSLRLFSCGGASVSADLIRRARAELGCVAKRVYGSTEFPTITTTDAADAASMGAETEGRPIAPAEVRIVNDDGGVLGPGCDGEIQARGPDCCVGYADPALNADAFTSDGWFRTGDLGQLDAAGYLRVTGRLKDIVIRKGEKFSVRELEELITRHPAVADAAVIALPDSRTGERACAVVTLRPHATLTLAQLVEFLRDAGLATQKLPEQLEVLAELPRTDSGKVSRVELVKKIHHQDTKTPKES